MSKTDETGQAWWWSAGSVEMVSNSSLPFFNLIYQRYYNIDTNSCSEFYFNGKGGNENQFDSHVMCMNTCYLESAESEENATQVTNTL